MHAPLLPSTSRELCPDRSHSRLRILVVDDEPPICEIIAVHLEDEGHEVQTAGDGSCGWSRFVGEQWDLVLTDRVMPGMTGDELARAIKRLKPSMPVVLVTGFIDLDPHGGAQPSPFDLTIRKPFTRETLTAALRLVCR